MLSRPGTKLGLSAAVVIAVYLILYEHTEVSSHVYGDGCKRVQRAEHVCVLLQAAPS